MMKVSAIYKPFYKRAWKMDSIFLKKKIAFEKNDFQKRLEGYSPAQDRKEIRIGALLTNCISLSSLDFNNIPCFIKKNK